jgi:hypothetical protein
MFKTSGRVVIAAAAVIALVSLSAAPASAAKVWTTYWSGSTAPNVVKSSHTHSLYGAQAWTNTKSVQDCAPPDFTQCGYVPVYALSTTVTLGSQTNTAGIGGTAQILRSTPISGKSTCKHGYATPAEFMYTPLTMVCRIQSEGKLTTPARAATPQPVALAAPFLPAEIASTESARSFRSAEVYRVHLLDGSECLIAWLAQSAAVSCAQAEVVDQYGLSLDFTTSVAKVKLVVPVDDGAQARSSLVSLGAGVYGG